MRAIVSLIGAAQLFFAIELTTPLTVVEVRDSLSAVRSYQSSKQWQLFGILKYVFEKDIKDIMDVDWWDYDTKWKVIRVPKTFGMEKPDL